MHASTIIEKSILCELLYEITRNQFTMALPTVGGTLKLENVGFLHTTAKKINKTAK